MNHFPLFVLATSLTAAPAAASDDVPTTTADAATTNADAAPTSPAAVEAAAANPKSTLSPAVLSFGTVWYLHAAYGEEAGNQGSRFYIGRGYLTGRVKPSSWFSSRASLDITQDDTGDLKARVKYMYGQLNLPDAGRLLSNTSLRFGVVHGPWLDYEEHINYYRMQGTMFQERNGLFNSADLGLTFETLLGPKLDADYQERVNHEFPGRWGSLSLGVYNGGGYHAEEKNDNKVVAGRLSVRPLGLWLPNLQLSYMTYLGRGNTAAEPRWQSHAAMVSLEHEYFAVTGTYAFGLGNQKGNRLTPRGNGLRYDGASFFAEAKWPAAHLSVFGRYDLFDWGTRHLTSGDPATTRIIAGAAWRFFGHNALVVDVDAVRADIAAAASDWQAKLTLLVEYP